MTRRGVHEHSLSVTTSANGCSRHGGVYGAQTPICLIRRSATDRAPCFSTTLAHAADGSVAWLLGGLDAARPDNLSHKNDRRHGGADASAARRPPKYSRPLAAPVCCAPSQNRPLRPDPICGATCEQSSPTEVDRSNGQAPSRPASRQWPHDDVNESDERTERRPRKTYSSARSSICPASCAPGPHDRAATFLVPRQRRLYVSSQPTRRRPALHRASLRDIPAPHHSKKIPAGF